PKASRIVYLVCGLLTIGMVNSTLKQLAGRSRPEWSVTLSKNKRQELQDYNTSHPQYTVPTSKEDHWFGPTLNRPYFMDRYTSFPSGHSATAFGIAACLTLLYPAGRSLWLVTAVCCALGR